MTKLKGYKVILTVSIDQQLYEQLQSYARQLDKSLSAVVNEAIENFLKLQHDGAKISILDYCPRPHIRELEQQDLRPIDNTSKSLSEMSKEELLEAARSDNYTTRVIAKGLLKAKYNIEVDKEK